MDVNPFDAILQEQDDEQSAPAPVMAQKPDNPFDEILREPDPPPESSMLGAASRSAVRGVIPAAVGIPAAGAGAEAGAAVGALAGPVGAAVGGIVGGLGGMLLGAMGGEALQDYAVAPLVSDDMKKRFGFTDEQRAADETQHPYASQLGGLVPYLVTSTPFSPKAVEKEMTALEAFMQKQPVQRALGGGLMGAWELGQEALNDEVDWTKVATATAFGVVFNHQNRVGQFLHGIGARPVQAITGRLPAETPSPEPSRSMNGALFSPRAMPDPFNPTLRELDAAGVMGPGNTEYTWMGTKRRPMLEELFAHKRLEEEYDTLYGPQQPTPDQITATARKMEPELFTERDALVEQRKSIEGAIELYRAPTMEQYDELRAQRSELEAKLAETKNKAEQRRIRVDIRALTTEIDAAWSRRQGSLEGKVDDHLTKLHSDLAAVNAQIREQGRDIARAHRRASEALGAGDMAMEHRFEDIPAYWREIAPDLFPAATPEAAAAGGGIAPELFTPAMGSTPPAEGGAPAAAAPAVDIAAERAKIAQAAKQELLNAGRPEDEAEQASQLIASRFVARAASFQGKRGTPYALYVADHAKITAWKRGGPPPPPSGPSGGPSAPPTAPSAGPSVMQAAEARLASAPAEAIPGKAPTADAVPGRLPEAPAVEVAPAVEGAVTEMPEAGAQPAPEAISAPAEPVPAGPAAGDRIVMNGTPYKIASIDDRSVSLTPTRAKDKASALALPRQAFDQMVADHAADKGVVDGEKVTLNGETLDPKLASLVKAKLAAQEAGDELRKIPENIRSSDTAALRRQMMDEALKSDEEFYAPKAESPAGTGGVTEQAPPQPRNEGLAQHRVTTAAGTKIDVRPKVVEARDLLASSDAGYDASLQPRNRERAASQGQIREIAGKLEPDRLGMSSEADRGAPIVGSDNMVESGNGRVLALREAYRQDGPAAARYRRWLQEQGFDVAGMKEPVLVRERVTEMTPEERRKFTVEANQSATLAMSASERSLADARSMSPTMLDLIVNPDDLGAIKNRPFVQAFIKTLPQAEQGAMTTAEGGLSAEGLARVRNAVLAKAYGDAALMARIAEATSDEVKSISNALTAGAPYWAKLRADVESGAVRADMDLTPELMEAVARTADLRGKGVKLDTFLSQMDAFDRLNTQVEAWMRMFYNETGRRAASGQVIAERIKYYAEEARKVSAEEGLAFDLPPVRPEDVQANAAQRGRESAAAEGQANLFESSGAGVRESGAAGGQEAGGSGAGEGGVRSGEAGAGGDQGGQGDGRTLNQNAASRALGKIVLKASGLREIFLKPDANPSTVIHETGHDFLEQMRADAAHELAPQQLIDDWSTVRVWLGMKEGQEAPTRKQHEKFARGFERYLFDGVSPSKELAVVFQRFANWLREVYRTVAGMTKPDAITPEIRAVFDRLLATDPHFVTVAGEGAGRRSMAEVHESEAMAVTPERAGPMSDRAMAEAERGVREETREVRNELGAAAERAGVGDAASGLGASAERAGGMAEDSGRSAAFSSGSASGARDGAESGGRGENADAGGGGGRAAGGRDASADAGAADDRFARDGRFVDKAGNIRLENLTDSESVKEAIREIAYGHNGFIAERRGRVSDSAVLSLAEEMGFDGAEDLVNRWVIGQAMNAEQIMALRLLVRESAADLHDKAKAVAAGGDWKAVRDYAVAKERHIAVQRTVSGVTAEAGRALRAFRDISGSTQAKAIEKLMRQATGQTLYQLRDEASLLAGLDNEVAINRNVRHMASNIGEGVLEYATNNLISGPITHMIYTVSNQELALWKALAETPFRAVISNAMKAAGKEMQPGEVTRFGEVWQQILGLGQGFAPALKAGAESMKVGLTTRLPRENMANLPGIRPGQEVVEAPMVDMAYSMKEVLPDMWGAARGSLDALAAYGKMLAIGKEGEPFFRWAKNPLYKIPDAKIRGVTVPVGSIENLPSRLVSSLHAFNRIQFYFMELNAEAYRAASAELEAGKIAPQDFNRRLAELKASPDALMIDRATKAATETTQMAPGGQLTQRLSRFVNSPIGGPNGPPLLRFIDPFIHISSNVLSGAFLKRTPLGFLSGPIREDLLGKNGRQAQTSAMARMAAGTSVLAFMGMMKAQGYITGAAPDDKAEAAMWSQAGYQPYSIKIDGAWYPYHRLGVLGLLMGIGADLYDVGAHLSKFGESYAKDDAKKMDEELNEAMGALLHSISTNVLEESFMRGPAELMKAVEGGEGSMSRYVRNFVSTMFTPFSVGMSQTARMADPVSRQARTLTDAIRNKIPGMSQDLFPRRNLWGEPIMAQTSIATKRAEADPVSQEVYRLGIAKAPVERKISGVELTDEQYDNYQRLAGRMSYEQLNAMIHSPGWYQVPDPMKKEYLEKAIDAQRQAARGLMMMKFRDIPQAAMDARRRRFTEIETRTLQ